MLMDKGQEEERRSLAAEEVVKQADQPWRRSGADRGVQIGPQMGDRVRLAREYLQYPQWQQHNVVPAR